MLPLYASTCSGSVWTRSAIDRPAYPGTALCVTLGTVTCLSVCGWTCMTQWKRSRSTLFLHCLANYICKFHIIRWIMLASVRWQCRTWRSLPRLALAWQSRTRIIRHVISPSTDIQHFHSLCGWMSVFVLDGSAILMHLTEYLAIKNHRESPTWTITYTDD